MDSLCESVEDIREGIACLNNGLDTIVNRHFCAGKMDICIGIRLINRALCKLLNCVKLFRCDLDLSELRRIQIGMVNVQAGISVICLGIKAICAGSRDDGIRAIRSGIQSVKTGLDEIVEGLGDLLCKENITSNNNGI